MNDYIFIEHVPEHYSGYEKHPVQMTVDVKKSVLKKYQSVIETELILAISRIEAIMGEEVGE